MIRRHYEVRGTVMTLTMTLNGLGNGAARQSFPVGSPEASDVLIWVVAKLAAGTPSVGGLIRVYAATTPTDTDPEGAWPGGTAFPDGVALADQAYTMYNPTNLLLLGRIHTPNAGALIYRSQALSLRAATRVFPGGWVLVVENATGVAFDATGSEARWRSVTNRWADMA